MGFFTKKPNSDTSTPNEKSEKDGSIRGGIKPMTSQALTDVTRGMHHAALATTNMLANQYLFLLNQFFDEDEDGLMRSKMVNVQLDDSHSMNIPLISMVAPKGLVMDRMKVSMSVRMEESDIKRATHEFDNSDATRASFKVQLSPRSESTTQGRASDIIDIDMEFLAIDPPEGIMKVIDEFVNLIAPFETNRKKEES
jgi:hypothetical protein